MPRFIHRPYAPMYVLPLLAVAVWLLNLGPAWDDVVSGWFFHALQASPDPLSQWALPKSNEALNWWLHKLPRTMFTVLGVVTLLIWLASYVRASLSAYRRMAALVTLAVILVPTAVALLKEYSGHYCPNRLARYGGLAPDNYAELAVIPEYASKADCYPAAHPSPGWALMILGIGAVTPRRRWLGIGLGVVAGGTLSMIQIARGEHFLSHNIATALIAWWIGWALCRAYDRLSTRKS
ncbi:MAG: phosphatase PAP2 family protein [Rickettsiales bacterium]|nr:phosphatase PAP2 family protein [Rickettsiales bacterium]